MTGEEFCRILRDNLDARNDSDLAQKLGITPAYVSQTKAQDQVSAAKVKKFLDRLLNSKIGMLVNSAVHPIVEFFPIQYCLSKRESKWLLFDYIQHSDLKSELEKNRGIYSFYNSEGEIVYIGKTERQNLLAEMTSALNLSRSSYKIYGVAHPYGKFKKNDFDKIRQIKKTPKTLADTCYYFSAYSTYGDLTAVLESLIIRIVPNDIVNVKMETGHSRAVTKAMKS